MEAENGVAVTLCFVPPFADNTKAANQTGRKTPGWERQEHLEKLYIVHEKEAKAIEGGGSCREIAAQDFEDDHAKESEQRRPESGEPGREEAGRQP